LDKSWLSLYLSCHEELKKYQEAAALVSFCNRFSIPLPCKKETEQMLLVCGKKALQEGKNQEALDLLTAYFSLSKVPVDATLVESFALLLISFYKKGDKKRALEALEQVKECPVALWHYLRAEMLAKEPNAFPLDCLKAYARGADGLPWEDQAWKDPRFDAKKEFYVYKTFAFNSLRKTYPENLLTLS
jgi:hypothetical protein